MFRSSIWMLGKLVQKQGDKVQFSKSETHGQQIVCSLCWKFKIVNLAANKFCIIVHSGLYRCLYWFVHMMLCCVRDLLMAFRAWFSLTISTTYRQPRSKATPQSSRHHPLHSQGHRVRLHLSVSSLWSISMIYPRQKRRITRMPFFIFLEKAKPHTANTCLES